MSQSAECLQLEYVPEGTQWLTTAIGDEFRINEALSEESDVSKRSAREGDKVFRQEHCGKLSAEGHGRGVDNFGSILRN